MNQLLTLVVVGAVGVAGWVLMRARATGSTAADVADALIATARAHMDAASGYDPTAETPETAAPALGDVAPDLDRLIEQDRAAWFGDRPNQGSGYEATDGATMDDRQVIARAECLRAVSLGLLPADQVDACTAGVAAAGRLGWVYTAPGSRAAVRIAIGTHGTPEWENRAPRGATDADPDLVP